MKGRKFGGAEQRHCCISWRSYSISILLTGGYCKHSIAPLLEISHIVAYREEKRRVSFADKGSSEILVVKMTEVNQINKKILEKMIKLEKLIKSFGAKNDEIATSTILLNKEVEQKVESLEGMHATALSCRRRFSPEWILDSGASRHVTGAQSELLSYKSHPSTNKETIQTVDGTWQPIKGIGTVNCPPSINLTSVLHVPSFPVNLLSLSALVDQIDCRPSFF